MPWKNGLGVTTQLAIHPGGATADAFEWRVSIAKVEGSAAFSVFPSIARWLAILQGEMTRMRDGHAPVTLNEDSAPVAFSGVVPAEGSVIRGPVFDLNLMYLPSRWRAAMRRVNASAGTFLSERVPVMLCSRIACGIDIAGERFEVEPFDLLRVDHDARLLAMSAIDGYVIELRERDP
jgi:environmental stress-induced protein Ves